jgi:hypothetical protein
MFSDVKIINNFEERKKGWYKERRIGEAERLFCVRGTAGAVRLSAAVRSTGAKRTPEETDPQGHAQKNIFSLFCPPAKYYGN